MQLHNVTLIPSKLMTYRDHVCVKTYSIKVHEFSQELPGLNLGTEFCSASDPQKL